MKTFTGYPLQNVAYAKRFISEHRGEALALVDNRYASTHHVTDEQIVDVFMSQFPRGRGTTRNPFAREFYAACHSVKAWQSMGIDKQRDEIRITETDADWLNHWNTRGVNAARGVNAGGADALRLFTLAGDPIKGKTGVPAKVWDRLDALGMTTAWFTQSEDGSRFYRDKIILTQYGWLILDHLIKGTE